MTMVNVANQLMPTLHRGDVCAGLTATQDSYFHKFSKLIAASRLPKLLQIVRTSN